VQVSGNHESRTRRHAPTPAVQVTPPQRGDRYDIKLRGSKQVVVVDQTPIIQSGHKFVLAWDETHGNIIQIDQKVLTNRVASNVPIPSDWDRARVEYLEKQSAKAFEKTEEG
jgi:hypothetical protein